MDYLSSIQRGENYNTHNQVDVQSKKRISDFINADPVLIGKSLKRPSAPFPHRSSQRGNFAQNCKVSVPYKNWSPLFN